MKQRLRCLRIFSLLVCLAITSIPILADSLAASSEWQDRWAVDGGAVARSKHERYGRNGEYGVEGHERIDGSLHVRVTRAGGMLVFQSTFPVRESDGQQYVRWTYRDGLQMVDKSALPPEVPRLETMMLAAKDIVRTVATAYERTGRSPDDQETTRGGRVASQDSWGCDIPDWSGLNVTCSSKGNCCDTHDSCFAAFDCSAMSWIYGTASGACHLCNLAVVACMTTGLLDTGQPSACCQLGNCGQERCKGTAWDDPGCVGGGGGSDTGCRGCVQHIDPAPTPGSGGGTWSYGPGGSISFSRGTCCFPASDMYPDGICLPCG